MPPNRLPADIWALVFQCLAHRDAERVRHALLAGPVSSFDLDAAWLSRCDFFEIQEGEDCLRTFSLVCREWYCLARPYHYGIINLFPGSKALQMDLEATGSDVNAASPRVGDLVRIIFIRQSHDGCAFRKDEHTTLQTFIEHCPNVFMIVAKHPWDQPLDLSFGPPSSLLVVALDVMGQDTALGVFNHPLHVRRLIFRGDMDYALKYGVEFPSLHTLSGSIVDLDSAGIHSPELKHLTLYAGHLGQVLASPFFTKHAANITTIEILAEWYDWFIFDDFLSCLPNLEELVIELNAGKRTPGPPHFLKKSVQRRGISRPPPRLRFVGLYLPAIRNDDEWDNHPEMVSLDEWLEFAFALKGSLKVLRWMNWDKESFPGNFGYPFTEFVQRRMDTLAELAANGVSLQTCRGKSLQVLITESGITWDSFLRLHGLNL